MHSFFLNAMNKAKNISSYIDLVDHSVKVNVKKKYSSNKLLKSELSL